MIKTDPTITESIVSWNNMFPLDRWWRKKYNIAYGCEAHKVISQISIYIEWKEDKIFEKHHRDQKIKKDKAESYKKGVWIEHYLSEQDEDDLFHALNVKDFKNG